MGSILRKLLYSIVLLSSSYHLQAQLIDDMEDESKLYAETKQVNQFFRRFNGEESEKGERYYPGDKAYQQEKLRKKYISILFDNDNINISNDLKKEFSEYVLNKENPVMLDFHSGQWFSEVHTTFSYKGKEETFILFMQLEQESLGYKWVISKVYAERYSDYLKKDTTEHSKFLHPLSHELDFMNLRKALDNKSSANQYTVKDFKPDYLTLFLYEIKKGELKFKTVNEVKFHFFQVNGWYFELSEFNRPGYNTGWLISNLVKASTGEKKLLYKYIYYDH